jgi:hypothetical protein
MASPARLRLWDAPGISSQLNATPAFTSAVSPASTGTTPQAYLTILFFDERFNFISAADGGVAQSQVAASVPGSGLQLSQLNLKAPKNGYAYVYVSNQSDQDGLSRQRSMAGFILIILR